MTSPACGRLEADRGAGQRRLATAGFADQADDLADVDATGSRRPPRAPACRRAGVHDFQVADLEHAHPTSSATARSGSTGQAIASSGRQVDQRRHRRRRQLIDAHSGSADGTHSRRAVRPGSAACRRSAPAAGRPASGCGSESSNPRVYGWRARCSTSAVGPVFDDPAGVHHRHRIGHCRHHAQIMRDQHHRQARFATQPVEQAQDAGLDRHVQRGGRLVGDQQSRFARQRHRDLDALAHAAAELVRIAAQRGLRIGNAHLLQQLDGAPSGVACGPCAGGRAGARSAGARWSTSGGATTSGPGTPSPPCGRARCAGRRRPACSRSRRRTARGHRFARHLAAEPQQRQRRHGLAAATLAGQTEHLARRADSKSTPSTIGDGRRSG